MSHLEATPPLWASVELATQLWHGASVICPTNRSQEFHLPSIAGRLAEIQFTKSPLT